ncbi:MAG TPA: amidase family protein [Dehalococcoidia bacterium]|jgi:amidase|nr:amidase family protein [Dehalococcoidia bacterium]
MNDIALLDASAQAELVRTKQVKAIELVDAAIDRIERLNPRINAVVTPMYDIARKAAEGQLPDGPFSGVPFLLKDLGPMYAGVRQASGTAFLKDMISPIDSELTKRYKAAGLIVVGKTNTPEFGLVPTTEPKLFGPSRNPWNPERTTGGSSGGSAAAVAAGMTSMAHANDGGGSIRIPASCCGLFGLKPTRARVPLGPLFGDQMSGLVIDHAVTRSVRDSAGLLDATAGPDLGDPYWAPPPERPFLQEVGADPGSLRIAFTQKKLYGEGALHPDCVDAVRDAVRLCEELGHEVTEAAPALNGDEIIDAFTKMWEGGVTSGIDTVIRFIGRTPGDDEIEPLTRTLYEAGKQVSASDYLLAVASMQLMARQVAAFHQQYDLWLTPTLGEPPVPLGSFEPTPDNPRAGFERAADFVPFTPLQNATGQPAMSVPLYWNAEGLPVGVHFAARFGDEATLFRLAAQLEEARPWAHKRPPVSA